MRPVAAKVDVGLGHGTMAKQQPETKDRLRQEVENGVDHDFGIDACFAGTISDSPNTAKESVVSSEQRTQYDRTLTWDTQSTAIA